jgi:integrase/recombinase XerD
MSPRRPVPKRPARTSVVLPGDPSDPAGFHRAVTEWLEWLAVHNYSPTTVVDRSWYLSLFMSWAELRGITGPRDVTLPVLESYQRHVSLRRKADGMPLAWSSQSKCLVPLRVFFAWCTRTRRILYNPASELVMPRQNHALPHATLTHDEVEQVMAIPDTTTVLGLRDRTVMEVLYATAMRRGELVGLHLVDTDLARRRLTLRQTKNQWDRVVPMGERAATWLERYLADARPQLVFGDDPGHVFLAMNGERLGPKWLSGQMRRYILAADIGKSGSCHIFRHSAATAMVEHGADIRYVQELLGHRDLSSTHIYTRVAPERLAAIHAATHPGAPLEGGS